MSAVAIARAMTTGSVLGLCALAAGLAIAPLRLAFSSRDPVQRALAARALTQSFAAGDLARRAVAVAENDPVKRAALLGAALSSAPAAGELWLDLAATRLAAGDAPEQVMAALRLSGLTTPNEARLMAQRASLSIPLWAVMPDDMRRRALADLVGGWTHVDEPHKAALRAALSFAPADMRARVLAALPQDAARRDNMQRSLGLQ
ncbi:MAG: hypothetical protein KGL46_12475 [Hyphomicrobiales bacterium]|nr:hypothetical protein [Hyphomicrobiales bacterium]